MAGEDVDRKITNKISSAFLESDNFSRVETYEQWQHMYDQPPINVAQIVAQQRKMAINYVLNATQQKSINLLNASLENPESALSQEIAAGKEAVQNDIKDLFMKLNKGQLNVSKIIDKQEKVEQYKQKWGQLITMYQNIVDNIRKKPLTNAELTNINNLDNLITDLQKSLTSINSKTNTLAEAQTIMAQTSINKSSNKSNLFSRLAGIGNALAGPEYESRIVEAISNYFIDTNANMQAVQTGAIQKKSRTVRLGQDIKQDSAIFDEAVWNKTIRLINGKYITIKELIDYINANPEKTIQINNKNYQRLQDLMTSAISIKTTTSNITTIHGGLNVQNLLNLTASHQDTYYYTLYHLHQLASQAKVDVLQKEEDKEYVKNIIDYQISKALVHIIGKKNNYYITTHGVISTYEILTTNLSEDKKKYFRSDDNFRLLHSFNVIAPTSLFRKIQF